jgi:hypothetical protein
VTTIPAVEEGRLGFFERGKRNQFDRFHLMMGKGAVRAADGSIVWEDADWMPNALADEGEQSMLNVYLLAASNPSKYLGLLNGGSPGETTTMSGITETQTPAANGYNRQQIASGDWASPTLNSGDYQTTAAQKTFGAASGSSWTTTHAYLTTTLADTLGKFLLYIALSATTTVAVGQQFLYTLTIKAQ